MTTINPNNASQIDYTLFFSNPETGERFTAGIKIDKTRLPELAHILVQNTVFEDTSQHSADELRDELRKTMLMEPLTGRFLVESAHSKTINEILQANLIDQKTADEIREGIASIGIEPEVAVAPARGPIKIGRNTIDFEKKTISGPRSITDTSIYATGWKMGLEVDTSIPKAPTVAKRG